jgi:hypothetical protein
MLTNPVFYKIEMVGKAKRKGTARGKQVKAGKVIIEARLDEQHRNIPFNEGRLKARQAKKARKRETKRRTGKQNNYRKPPVKRQKTPIPISEESDSQKADRSSDENFPDVPSVRVLRTRVIVSEEEEEEEIDELEAEEMDEVEEELDHMDVDDEDDYMDL